MEKNIASEDFIKSSHSMKISHEITDFFSNVKLILVQGDVNPNNMKLEMSQKVMDAINEVQKIIIFFMEDSQ